MRDVDVPQSLFRVAGNASERRRNGRCWACGILGEETADGGGGGGRRGLM